MFGGGKMNKYKELRKKMGLTQCELAKKLNLNQTTVGKWELDKALPDYASLINLSKLYGVSVDYLVGASANELVVQQNDLGVITDKQSQLFKMIQKLDNDRFFMVYGYTERLLREMI
jgi:transcriptional regulator with XRE-family HTH domain